jgi:hypothetical protein
MALTCKIGPALTFDAVAAVRGYIEDDSAPFIVSDARMQNYVEMAAESFSKWTPLGENVVGQIGGSPPTSPFQTIAGVSRYACTAAIGFTPPAVEITDVLYRASGVFTAASEIAYLALMPVSPLNWFRVDRDILMSPSSRHLRDEYLQELDHYGTGYWGRARDAATGLPAIDIYPPPTVSGIPIFVRYTSAHGNTPDGNGNPQYPTIPDNWKRHFVTQLLVEVVKEEANRLMLKSQVKAGQIQRWSSPGDMRRWADQLHEDSVNEMGGNVGVAIVSW